MKKSALIFAVLLLGFSNFSFNKVQDLPNSGDKSDPIYTSHVIIKITGFTLEQYNSLASIYLKRQDVEIEYYCLEAGILIMHYVHFGLSNADIQQSVKSELLKTIKNSNIRILDVDTRSEDMDSRC